jgi:hypothetical protein
VIPVLLLSASGSVSLARRVLRLPWSAHGDSATRDTLTGLPARTLLYDRVSQALARATRSDKRRRALRGPRPLQGMNDTYGHDRGDRVLKEAARRLERCVHHRHRGALQRRRVRLVLTGLPRRRRPASSPPGWRSCTACSTWAG